MGKLDNKVAIVTGGASGLGKATASLFAKEGAVVTITDVNEERGRFVAEEISAFYLHQDVSDESRWHAVIDQVSTTHQGIHILVNNAGISDNAETSNPEFTSFDDWQKVMTVNAGGVFLGCKIAIPAIRDSGGGAIINMSSIAALVSTPFLAAYGASKAAVAQLTKSVAIYCAENGYGIRCNSVHPGQISTPMHDRLISDVAKVSGINVEEARALFLEKIPMGEFGSPDDIAEGVLYLASDAGKHITGQELVIDGGMHHFR